MQQSTESQLVVTSIVCGIAAVIAVIALFFVSQNRNMWVKDAKNWHGQIVQVKAGCHPDPDGSAKCDPGTFVVDVKGK